ncbi:alpha/beta hydrolase [Streptomyces sp. NPDC001948]
MRRLILESAVGLMPWPERRTRLAADVAFTAVTERATWAMMRALLRTAPDTALRLLMGDLPSRPAGEVVAGLSDADRDTLVGLFARTRSGRGFRNDVRRFADQMARPRQPALVIGARNDAAVPFAHAEALAAALPAAELVESAADSHFVWFGSGWPAIAERIRGFVVAPVEGAVSGVLPGQRFLTASS